MPADRTDPDELLRLFERATSGAELDDLRQLAQDISLIIPGSAGRERPRLRRPPRRDVVTYRMRVELDDSLPPIWRRLDVRSNVTLDVLHEVLQAAYEWTDSHLHRFSIGGRPFDAHSELFLCPFDVEEGDLGTPAAAVRLDETMHEPGDVLHYAYDYGDGWELTLRLEHVLPRRPDQPTAVCLDGQRAAPPEDCGGLRTAAELAEVIEDPTAFDLETVNDELQSPYQRLRDSGVEPRLVELLYRMQFTGGSQLIERALSLLRPWPVPGPEQLADVLRPHLWYLDRGAEGGFRLTQAGYLKPVDVAAAAAIVPEMADWWGMPTRESDAYPLLAFRESLQRMGLLRKVKGRLVLTKAGAAMRGNPERLFAHLGTRLIPAKLDGFSEHATLLFLLSAATCDGEVDLGEVADALTGLGWGRSGGGPIRQYDLYSLKNDPVRTLRNVTAGAEGGGERELVGPVAAALARASTAAVHLSREKTREDPSAAPTRRLATTSLNCGWRIRRMGRPRLHHRLLGPRHGEAGVAGLAPSIGRRCWRPQPLLRPDHPPTDPKERREPAMHVRQVVMGRLAGRSPGPKPREDPRIRRSSVLGGSSGGRTSRAVGGDRPAIRPDASYR